MLNPEHGCVYELSIMTFPIKVASMTNPSHIIVSHCIPNHPHLPTKWLLEYLYSWLLELPMCLTVMAWFLLRDFSEKKHLDIPRGEEAKEPGSKVHGVNPT